MKSDGKITKLSSFEIKDQNNLSSSEILRVAMNSAKEAALYNPYEKVKAVAITASYKVVREDTGEVVAKVYDIQAYGSVEGHRCDIHCEAEGLNQWYNSRGKLFHLCDQHLYSLSEAMPDYEQIGPRKYRSKKE